MKMILVALLATLSASLQPAAQACTIFRSPVLGDSRIGHNVDWYEQFANVKAVFGLNASGRHKIAGLIPSPLLPVEWTSRYKSATFTIAGAEFPVSGFNEKGLFMAVLMLNETKYPPLEDARPAVSVTQFVQYNLDQSATIDEVIASVQTLRPYSALKMHYFTCDARAKCAVLQFINGELQAYQQMPFDVLTNSLYPASVEAARACSAESCEQPNTSLWRFAQASLLRQKMEGDFNDGAFSILSKVAQRKGLISRYSLAYDQAAARMSVRADGGEVAFVNVDFSKVRCGADFPVIPIDASSRGDLSGQWQNLTRELQYQMPLGIGHPPAVAEIVSKYPFEATSCEK